MRRVFCIHPARTCCVSIEVAPFLPLLFTASVSSAESVYASPCEPGLLYPLAGTSFKMTMPNRDLSLDLLCHSLHRTTFAGSRMVSHLSGSPFLTSGGLLLGCDQTVRESLAPSVLFVPF